MSSIKIKDLQNILRDAGVDFSGAKKKADYIKLYMQLKDKEQIAMEQTAMEQADNEPVLKEPVPVLKELVISIAILSHGCENFTAPWTKDMSISEFYRNKVRVYSRSCVPDVNAIGNTFENIEILRDLKETFSKASETAPIIREYADKVKQDYIIRVAQSDRSISGHDKMIDINNLARVSGLSTFLSNKIFSFYNIDPEEKITGPHEQFLFQTIGIHVTDIREKITNSDGSIIYQQVFSPSYDHGFSSCNLSYRDGLTHILKNVLKKKELVKPMLELFGFKGRNHRVTELTLEQLYGFFKLIGADYVNIMDYSCRKCSIGPLPPGMGDKIYQIEQKYSEKPVGFGKKQSKNRKNRKNKNRKTRNKK